MMSVMNLEEYIKLGRECNLEGRELLEFAKEQVAEKRKIERDERLSEREIKQMEIEEKERERLEREKEREHEKELKLLEQRSNEGERETEVSIAESTTVHFTRGQAKYPHLPPFNENKDDIDSYLRRFERYAGTMGWPVEEWSLPLSTLLTGRALEVYSRMPDEQSTDYDMLKTALLLKYELTEEGFRVRFRSSKLDSNETYTQFITRIEGYLGRWVELSGSGESYDSLVDLILREQLLNVCSRELNFFSKRDYRVIYG